MRFQRSDESWIVSVRRGEFPGSTSAWPGEFAIGTISNKPGGAVDPWDKPISLSQRALDAWNKRSVDSYEQAARRILTAPKTQEKLVEAKKKYHREEQRNGSFIVRATGEKERRFHEFKRAMEWAHFALNGRRKGSRAEFFRAPVPGSTLPLTGSPWSEPMTALEVDEYGHVVMARLVPSRFGKLASR